MTGIFSSRPGQPAIRMIVGTHLLLTIQAGLVLWSATELDMGLRCIVGAAGLLGLAAIITAIRGGDEEEGRVWRPYRLRNHAWRRGGHS
ncbi:MULTISPECIES: hypothetical protein [Sphingobium]|jgi:hypothetical protein|uniref:hypothetical protein n=1 Tax=Sphingobium TaxID=165695 RepID=UPI001C122A34|nr:hypothetical protein [Sphingobium sp. RSMS]UXC92991.1 hypothetical protein EGM87_22085 [Sphingobium sp. RSMS]